MNCIFCKIIKKEISSNIEYEDDQLMVFQDIHPKAPVHLLIVPKVHIDNLDQVGEDHKELLGELVWQASQLAKEKGINQKGYKLVMNCGREGGQTVDHLHLHLVGGKNVAGVL